MPATPRLNCSFTEPRWTCRGLGLLPPPTKPRPAGVWSLQRFAGSGQARVRVGRGMHRVFGVRVASLARHVRQELGPDLGGVLAERGHGAVAPRRAVVARGRG